MIMTGSVLGRPIPARARLRLVLAHRPAASPLRFRRRICVAAAAPGVNIAVVGAGVVGLTTAYRLLQEVPQARVTVLAERFAHDTTTAGAAGIWGPWKLSDTPIDRIHKWSKATHDHLTLLYSSATAAQTGVSLVSGTQVSRQKEPDPFWRDIVFRYARLTAHDLALYPPGVVGGYSYSTFLCEGRYYLNWLTTNITQLRGTFVQCRLTHLAELATYDLVVNCCGLGASQLMSDADVYPIRGQIVRARAPWVKEFSFCDPYYIIPTRDFVVLGGTAQVGDWNTSASLADARAIWDGCMALQPSLHMAEVMGEWVGLRPGRTRLRLEFEQLATPSGALAVVHNYGHGGSGLTLGWGTAGDAVKLARQVLALQ